MEAGAARAAPCDFRFTALHGTQDTIAAGFTKYTFNYPTQSAVVSWQADIRRAVVVRTRVGAVDRRARDPYAVWDLNAAMTRGRVHPFVQVANLTSTSYQEILGVAMPGRSIIGGIEVLLKRR